MKGRHRPVQRIVLPNGMWLLLHDDRSLKVAGYNSAKKAPRQVAARADDLVTLARSLTTALERVRR